MPMPMDGVLAVAHFSITGVKLKSLLKLVLKRVLALDALDRLPFFQEAIHGIRNIEPRSFKRLSFFRYPNKWQTTPATVARRPGQPRRDRRPECH